MKLGARLVTSNVISAFEKLAHDAEAETASKQRSIWGDDPAQLVHCHATIIALTLTKPRSSWVWADIERSWDAIKRRSAMFFVEDWLHEVGEDISKFFLQNRPRELTHVRDRSGTIHALQRA